MHTLCLFPLQAKIFGQSFMMSRLNVAVDDVANAEAEKKAQLVVFEITVKFLTFGTPEVFAVIYLKFEQRGQTLKGIMSKWCKWNSK